MITTLRRVLDAPFGAALLVAALLAGCGGGGGGGDTPAAAGNSAPRAAISLSGQLVSANGTGDAATFTGADVKLDAGASVDPDGDALTFSWSLVSKPASSSADIKGTAATLTWKADVAGTYVLSVRVSDTKGAFADKQATVVVTGNAAPVASVAVSASYTAVPGVAAVRNVTVGASILLDSTGTVDADGDAVVTSWDLTERPAASKAGLTIDARTARLSVDTAGVFTVRARATDSHGAYSETVYPFEAFGTVPQVVVLTTVDLSSPFDAGTTVVSGTTGYQMSLSGAGSTYVGDGALTYAWTLVSKPVGSTTTLDSAAGPFAQMTPDILGDYTVKLVVTAPTGAASSYTTIVSVKNRRPVAAIGSNATPVSLPSGPTLRLPANSTVTLRGTSSVDADGDALAYLWTLVSKPAGSAAALASNNLSTTTLTTDLSGSYQVLLRVTDPSGAYSEQTLTVASGNAAPVAVVDKSSMSVLAGVASTASAALSYDDDGDPLTYSWALDVKPATSGATVSSAASTLAFTPDIAGTYVASVTVSDGKASSIAYVTIKALSGTVTSTSLSFSPVYSRYSRGLDRMVLVSTGPNLLSIVDPFTGGLRQVPLPGAAKALTLSQDGKLAAVLLEGVVSLVDIDSATLLHSSATGGSQTEAFVTNAGIVYMAGQTGGQWVTPTVAVVDGKTGLDLTATLGRADGWYFYGTLHGVYSPVKRKAFVVSEGLSPVDIDYFTLDAKGAVSAVGDSPYHGDYAMSGPLFLSAGEDLVFTGQGTYFRTDTLAYAGKLGMTGTIASMTHSATADEALAMGSTGDYIYVNNNYVYRYTYRASYQRFTGPLLFADTDVALPVIGGAQSYGVAIFHSANDNHVALVQTGSAVSGTAGVKYYVVLR
jgi:hypothetical protein